MLTPTDLVHHLLGRPRLVLLSGLPGTLVGRPHGDSADHVQSTAGEEAQPDSAPEADLPQALPQIVQYTASAAGADDGETSWAAWRADRKGEVGLYAPHQELTCGGNNNWLQWDRVNVLSINAAMQDTEWNVHTRACAELCDADLILINLQEPQRAFGQHTGGTEDAEGEQGAMTWQHIIGPPGSRSSARTVKRPRVHRPR